MQVYSWGRGEDGQLGLGDKSNQLMPRVVEQLTDKNVQMIACGSGHTVVLSGDGQVFSWGRGDDGRLGHGDHGWKYEPKQVVALKWKKIIQVTCGSYHTAAVSNTGELFTWGGGMYGKCGHGSEIGSNIPRRVEALKDKIVVQVACGSRHTVALVLNKEAESESSATTTQGTSVTSSASIRPMGSDMDVYAWGDRESGVAGHGEPLEGYQYFPRLLEALVGKGVCQIAACGFHSGAVTDFGEVYTWGEGKFGRLGHGKETNQTSPKLVADDALKSSRVVQISCGGFHTAAITDEGELFTWGGGEHGQLGHGNKENYARPTLVRALQGTKVKQVTCGWSHTVLLSQEGEVLSCGNGDHGKLGFGDTEKVTVPKRVEWLASKRILRVATYNEHTTALAMSASLDLSIPNPSLLSDLASLVNNPLFSDVTFLVGDTRVHAHRVILSARSAHFRAMFNSGMKESRESEITIYDTRAVVFVALLQFIYTESVDVEPDVAIELYVLADLYAMDRLKSQCETVIHSGLCHTNAALLLNVADQHNAYSLKQLCMRYIIRHFETITKSDSFAQLNKNLILEVLQNK